MFCIKKSELEKYESQCLLVNTKGDRFIFLLDEDMCKKAVQQMDVGETVGLQNEDGEITSTMIYDVDYCFYRERANKVV